ncbi:hypothetical protein RND71_033785 [Anisodus tanguticus]|uniref:Chlororespiratory reduction 21 n=1 Tax=Anisodus tanguticus TaxID=243964 RepID=A0AAE1R8Z3_9SOLA|nr:hypothetical protein RND71_033785 [Anisodus tanguticus]
MLFQIPKNISSIYRTISIAASLSPKPNSHFIQHSLFHFFHYTEEVLASKLAPILQSCTTCTQNLSSVLRTGQQVHAQVTINGIDNLGILGTRILGMYVLCNRFIDAKKLFFQLQLCYASPWNWMIRGYTTMGRFDLAIFLFFKMLVFGTCPDKYTFPYVIKACGGLSAVSLGKWLHGLVQSLGFEDDVFVGSGFIKFYSENGCLDDARLLFDKMSQRDSVLWNVMLNGYAKDEQSVNDVVGLFREMRRSETKPNSVTYACVLSVCASETMVKFGCQLHGLVVRCGLEMDSPVANTLIAMHAKFCSLFDARRIFNLVPQADRVTWNGMIGGYVQNGYMDEALELFHEMVVTSVKPDSITFASLLPLVSISEDIYQGKAIHGYIVRHDVSMDVFLKNAIIDMYFKCGNVEAARNIYNCSPAVDVVICTAMVSGFILNGMSSDALDVFRWLLNKKMSPNPVTLASILPACANLAALKLGKELHGIIVKRSFQGILYVGSAVMDMYAKCGRLDLSQQVFRRMSGRDVVCWNSMITSCCQNAEPELAIHFFQQMGANGAKYDCVSISSALSACANLPALHYGKEIHGFIMKSELSSDLIVESALIDMYAKCGNLDVAWRVFELMAHKNEVSWNSIIAAYGNHGRLTDCLDLFHGMRKDGFLPDHVTFLAIISACGHSGRVEEGKHYFNCMTNEYGITPRTEHYACMVDLFGRAGLVEEAFGVIKSMPFVPDAGIWGTLLGACRLHGNTELAEMASEHLLSLDPQNSGYYMLQSNLHANAGKWDMVSKIRHMMKGRGVQKVPGYSWTEVNNSTHIFVAADTSHPQSAQIYLLLDNLLMELRSEGYVLTLYFSHSTSGFQ